MNLIPFVPAEPPVPVVHHHPLEAKLGKAVVDALRERDLLVPSGEPTWYPCGAIGRGCNRKVFRFEHRGEAEPHVALCTGNECANLRLTSERLRASTLRCDQLVGILQELLGMPSRDAVPDEFVTFTWIAGTRSFGNRERRVLALFQPIPGRLAHSLESLCKRHSPAVALLFTSHSISTDLLGKYRPGAELELVLVDHHLRFEEGRFRWVGEEVGRVSEASEPEGYALAFDGKSMRTIGAPEYKRLVAEANKNLDLLVDLRSVRSGRCSVQCREPEGALRTVQLKHKLAVAFGKLMRSKEPIRASALLPGTKDAFRILARARATFDFSPKRGEWGCFPTASGKETGGELIFQPPPGYRYLLLSPVEQG